MSEEKDDYSYWSENLHSAYLFYTMEVDKLNKQNKQMREALKAISKAHSETVARIMKYAQQALNEVNNEK